MKTLINYYFLFLISPLLVVGCDSPTDVTRDSENIELASPAQIQKWELTNKTLLGIRANDPVDGELSTMSQNWGWYWNGFQSFYQEIFNALSDEKQNVGGTLNRYGSHGEDNNSNDINLWMIIFNEYQSFYNTVEFNKNSDWLYPYVLEGPQLSCEEKDTNTPFLLGEIAVPNNFLDNNFFFRREDCEQCHCESGLFLHKLDTFGMYGVVTTDRHHGNVPEVHPAQQIWYRNKDIYTTDKSGYWLMAFQDGSDRFVDWIGSPMYCQYQIAFRINPTKMKPNTGALTMDINLSDKSDLVTSDFSDQRRDCDNGTNHSLIIDGKKILTVNESGFDDDDMGIQFIELTKLQDGTIQGYVQVSLVIGDYDTDEFGMAILSLVITQPKNMLIKETGIDEATKERQ
ncbi:MAG: hypothetical protein ACKVPJ_01225 [Chitinophagales bacterium]